MDNCLVVTPGLLEGFREWLLGEEKTSEGTVRKYMYYLPKIQGMVLCGKQDVSLAFERMKLTKVSYEAFSRLLTYVEKKLEGYEELVAKLRKAMPKKPKTREDTYVPPDEKVRGLINCLKARGQAYHLIALILAYAGLRGTEARFILENARRLQAVELPYGAVRVHMPSEEQERGTKRAYVAYMPKWLWDAVRSYHGRIPHEDTIEKRFRECGLPLKYLRKWWRQKAKLAGVDSETIEAFQGRPRTVGGRHYTDWIPILDAEYEKIKDILSRALLLG
jgi:intergrase/recombinase